MLGRRGNITATAKHETCSPHAAVVLKAPTRVTRVLLLHAMRLREELQEEIKWSAWRTLLRAKGWMQGAGCCVWRMKRGES